MLEAKVRGLVSSYLVKAIAVEELEQLLPDGWELDEAEDEAGRKIALEVMGHVSEFMAGEISDSDLRERLLPYAGLVVTRTYSRSADRTVGTTTPETEQVFGAGTSLRVGFS